MRKKNGEAKAKQKKRENVVEELRSLTVRRTSAALPADCWPKTAKLSARSRGSEGDSDVDQGGGGGAGIDSLPAEAEKRQRRWAQASAADTWKTQSHAASNLRRWRRSFLPSFYLL